MPQEALEYLIVNERLLRPRIREVVGTQTSDMSNRIPDLIAFASSVCTLEPGDVSATRTNHRGLGPVQDGDLVTLEITNRGTPTVNVTDEQKRTWSREIDQEMAQRVRAM